MIELTELSPCAGLLPLEIGDLRITEAGQQHLTTVAPFKGRAAAVSAAMEAAHGMAFPAPGRSTGKAGGRAIWFGRGMALMMGPAPDAALGADAALTDQSDAWCVVRLEGAGARDVLARLTPLDLRGTVFKQGHTARSDLRHMHASITRIGPQSWQVMVFRSFARTLVHDLAEAAGMVAARAGLGQTADQS